MDEVREVLREQRLTIGDEGDTGDRERQQARVKRMLVALGVTEEELDAELKDHKQEQEVCRPKSCSCADILSRCCCEWFLQVIFCSKAASRSTQLW